MAPRQGYVPCFCEDCKGERQPRSTRNKHHRALKRRVSSSKGSSRSNKSLRSPQDVPYVAAAQVEGRLGTQVDSADVREGEVADEVTAPMEDVRLADSVPSNGSSRAASLLAGVGAPLWAFIRGALPPSSPHVLAPSSVAIDAVPASSFGPPCRRPLSDAEGSRTSSEGVSNPDAPVLDSPRLSSETVEEEGIYDDEWGESGVDGAEIAQAPSSLACRIPPLTAGAPPEAPNNISLHAETPSREQSDEIATRGIPLNRSALARMHEPDPFFAPTPAARGNRLTTVCGEIHPALVLAMLLVAWLHITAHLPFKFCDVILTVIGYILAETGQNALVPLLHCTLTSCLATLRLDPQFSAYPTCPACLAVYPESISADVHARCSGCGHPLFKANSEGVSDRQRRKRGGKAAKAYLRTPAKSLAEQLAELVMQPGMEEALESWRTRTRSPGWLNDFFDGAISRELLGPDGKPFFRHELKEDPDGELRIGVALGVDWFSYIRSQIAPSYSSCPMSFNLINLPPFLRYRASNLLLSMIIPGPKESDPDQTQGFLKIIVNELIRLWRDGIVLPTHRCPHGRRIRVILVGVFCDKPAAHKLGGFGSHQHTFFCTRDWISQGLKATKEAFTENGFRARTDEQHRWLMDEYRQAQTKSAREEHASLYATRWSELARLPYFDLCRMIVVDPMHNLFLGLVKSHFYHIWVQLKIFRKSKELNRVHEILAELALPSKLGRLPRLIGEPAGGSLTADQWLILATIVGPLAFPELWDGINHPEGDLTFFEERLAHIRREVASRKASRKSGKRKTPSSRSSTTANKSKVQTSEDGVRRSTRVRYPTEKAKDLVLEADDAGATLDDDDSAWMDVEDEDDSQQHSRLHQRDLATFLKLCMAIRLFLSESISEEQLVNADKLIREYCQDLIEMSYVQIITTRLTPPNVFATMGLFAAIGLSSSSG